MSQINFPSSVPIKGRVRVCLEYIKSVNLKNKVVVDIGSSFGWLEKELLKENPKKVIGIESNVEAVKFAQKKVKGAIFVVGSALKLPVKNNTADIAILFDVIEHVPKNSEVKTLNEINRVLKKNGMLFLSTPNKNIFSNILDIAWYFGHRHYSKEELIDFLKKSNFKVIKLEIRGDIYSSLFLVWFYITKRLIKGQPRNNFLEKLDDLGYNTGRITDVFLIAKKIK